MNNNETNHKVSHVGKAGIEDGYMVHYIRPKTEPKALSVPVNETRASIIFPTPSIPGYFLFMAEKYERNKVRKNSLLFLKEGEYKGYSELLENFSDWAVKLKCKIVYCDQNETGFLFTMKKRVPLLHAPLHLPFGDDEAYGMILVREWLADKSLLIPTDTILSDQLKSTTEATLPPSFHAIRQIVGGFLTDNTARMKAGAKVVEPSGYHWG